MNKSISFHGKTAVFWTDGTLPTNTMALAKSDFVKQIIHSYLAELRKHDSPLLKILPEGLTAEKQEGFIDDLFIRLTTERAEQVCRRDPGFTACLADKHLANQFIEEFYDYWRKFERYLVCRSDEYLNFDKQPYTTFNDTVERMNHLFRKMYRDICENITGNHPWIYRQIPAGFQVGMIVADRIWPCPAEYSNVKKIPFIRQTLLYPPLIIDPTMNKRTGQFRRVDSNPLEGIGLDSGGWLCYPAKVGDIVIHVYFHDKLISLGCALSNLFEIAVDEDLKRKPDAIFAYGLPSGSLSKFDGLPTVFYDDVENGLLVGAIPGDDAYGYFGYLKKMMLTLHNIAVMKRGRMPVHGAMVNIELKSGKSANIVILGDTGAGKSESLEAFRALSDEYIRKMTIVFDDMGSLDIKKGKITAYGTEIGAFVRLDDLQLGFAFGNMDRSIIMSPQKVNSRVVMPVTTLHDVLKGYDVDYFLYANNYESIDDSHPLLEKFENIPDAMKVFSEGAVMSKGTTTSTGLVHTYYANVFGPAQCKAMHEEIASRFFKEFFAQGIFVGQIRTRLGIVGFESQGPIEAAKALFAAIK